MKTESEYCDCPDPEVLSSYFDSELAPDSSEAKHIESCEFCQRHLAVYRQLSDRIRSELRKSVPDDFAERMVAGVRERLSHADAPPKNIPFPVLGTLMKIAAAVVICGGLTFYFVGKKFASPTEKIAKDGGLGQKESLRDFAAHGVENDSYSPNSSAGAIPLSDMETVSFGETPETMAQATSEGTNRMRPVEIPNRVRHVWVVDNLDKVKKDLEDFVKNHDIPANKVVIRDDRGRDVKVNMRLTKRQLVGLVKSCAGQGLELLSPQAPQPEENRFVGNAKSPVQYNADFVLDDKGK